MARQWLASLKVQLPRKLEEFAHNDATGGVIMMFCTVLALVLQNGSYSTSYRHWLEMSAGVMFGDFSLIKPLLLWINDGLITIFFFSIGLELKIEFIKGHLSDRRNIILPSLGAFAGIVFPSLFFIAFNYDNAFAMRGWAIPTSTDTAFSLALLLLLGSRVPASLKIFLLSMAIFDDIGAILVIALFYTSELSGPALILAAFALMCLLTLNYFGASRHMFYVFFGVIMWFAILKSGVHATLAGIITAFCIPMKNADDKPMVEPIYHSLKMWVALVVLPIFTIANAGVDLSMIDLNGLFSPVSLGIFTGLFFGKQIGIFLVIWLCIKLRVVKMPVDATYPQIYGVCILTGIGFSMSMFIDTLAYQGSNVFEYADSLAILLASLCSGVFGYCYLRFFACRTKAIEYRPWLPAPHGYRGSMATANLYTLEAPIQGPASVAPTAALVAEAAARAAAARQAAEAAEEAANAAQVAAEVAQKVAATEEVDDKTVAEVQLAAAQAAQAAASAAVSTSKLDDSEETADTAEVAAAALEAAQAVADSAAEAVEEAAKAEEEAAAAEEAAQAEEEAQDEAEAQDDKSAATSEAAVNEAIDAAQETIAAETDDAAEAGAELVVVAVAKAQAAESQAEAVPAAEEGTKAAEESGAAETKSAAAPAESSQGEIEKKDKSDLKVQADKKAESDKKTESDKKAESEDKGQSDKAEDEGGVLSSVVETTVKVAKAVTTLVKGEDEEAEPKSKDEGAKKAASAEQAESDKSEADQKADEKKADKTADKKAEQAADKAADKKADDKKAEPKAEDDQEEEGGVLSSVVETTVKVAKAVTSLVKSDSEDEAEGSEKEKSEKTEKVKTEKAKTEKAKSAKDEAADEPESEEDTVAEDAEKYLKHIVAKAQAQVLQTPKQVKTDEELAAIRARAEALAASMAKPQATLVEPEGEPKDSEEGAEPATGLKVADVAPEAVSAATTAPTAAPAAETSGLKVADVLATEPAQPSETKDQAASNAEPQAQAAAKDPESK